MKRSSNFATVSIVAAFTTMGLALAGCGSNNTATSDAGHDGSSGRSGSAGVGGGSGSGGEGSGQGRSGGAAGGQGGGSNGQGGNSGQGGNTPDAGIDAGGGAGRDATGGTGGGGTPGQSLDQCFAGLPAPVGTHQVATKVSADGKTRIRIALDTEDGFGINTPWRLIRFGLERDELKICVTDRTKLVYQTSHHNCQDTATVTADDLRFDLSNPDTGRTGHPGTKVSAFQGATRLWGPDTLMDTMCVTNRQDEMCRSGGPCI